MRSITRFLLSVPLIVLPILSIFGFTSSPVKEQGAPWANVPEKLSGTILIVPKIEYEDPYAALNTNSWNVGHYDQYFKNDSNATTGTPNRFVQAFNKYIDRFNKKADRYLRHYYKHDYVLISKKEFVESGDKYADTHTYRYILDWRIELYKGHHLSSETIQTINGPREVSRSGTTEFWYRSFYFYDRQEQYMYPSVEARSNQRWTTFRRLCKVMNKR